MAIAIKVAVTHCSGHDLRPAGGTRQVPAISWASWPSFLVQPWRPATGMRASPAVMPPAPRTGPSPWPGAALGPLVAALAAVGRRCGPVLPSAWRSRHAWSGCGAPRLVRTSMRDGVRAAGTRRRPCGPLGGVLAGALPSESRGPHTGPRGAGAACAVAGWPILLSRQRHQEEAMRPHWRLGRTLQEHRDGPWRWDRADQLLLDWAQTPAPSPAEPGQ
jgi:hypothetical protein